MGPSDKIPARHEGLVNVQQAAAPAVEQVLSPRRRIQATDQVQQRRLSAAIITLQSNSLGPDYF